MSDGFASPVVGGGNDLIRQEIQSPDFQTGVVGWRIAKDGTAEFNGVIIRGVLTGTSYIVNSAGAFFYSGTPALGNLTASIASAGGTDGFGNVYVAGFATYYSDGRVAGSMMPNSHAATVTSTSDDPPAFAVASSLFNGTLMIAGNTSIGSFTSVMQAYWDGIGIVMQLFTATGVNGAVLLRETVNANAAWIANTAAAWTAPPYNTNWLTSTTFNGSSGNQGLRLKVDVLDSIEIEGAFKCGAVAPAATVFTMGGTVFQTLASNYWVSGWRNRAGVVIPMGFQFTHAGALNVQTGMGGGAPVANDEYWIPKQSISLGNV